MGVGSVVESKLDDDANPAVRWNESFSDFVYSGLIPQVSASLTATTQSGVAYINGTRVVKDATNKTYTSSRYTFVDLSSTGVYTYQEITFDGTEPGVSLDSIRLARVSTDSDEVLSIRDDRDTTLTSIASATKILSTDNRVQIQTEEVAGEDLLRFDVAAAEQIVLSDGILYPSVDNDVDLGTASQEFKNIYIDGTANIDSLSADALGAALDANSQAITNINVDSGTIDNVTMGNSTSVEGTFARVWLAEQTLGPSTAANEGAIYTKDVAGNTELYYRDDTNGTEIQMTSGGLVKGAYFTLISTTSGSGTNTGDITIAADKSYRVTVEISGNSIDSQLDLVFNSDSTGTDYQYHTIRTDLGAATVTLTNSGGAATAVLLTLDNAGFLNGEFYFNTADADAEIDVAFIFDAIYKDAALTDYASHESKGMYAGGAVTSFELVFTQTTTFIVRVYELGK